MILAPFVGRPRRPLRDGGRPPQPFFGAGAGFQSGGVPSGLGRVHEAPDLGVCKTNRP